EEKAYLRNNNGCYKCRRIHVGHQFVDCPLGHPSSNVTIIPPKPTAKVDVKAVHSSSKDEDANQTDEDKNDMNEYVECDGEPLQLPCPLFSLHTMALIDSGCSTLLVSDDLVSKLQLEVCRKKLPHIQRVSLALKGKKESVYNISEYVCLPLSFPQSKWTAGTLTFKIAPIDGFGVILSVPFLYKYNLAVSFMPVSSLKIQSTGYDLVPAKSSSKAPLSSTGKKVKRPVIGALTLSPTLKPEEVEEEEILCKKTEEMMREFEDRFPVDLPGIGPAPPNLPKDGLDTARIRLKDPEQKIKTRTYSCPRRYLHSFQELIKQHLDAGRIRVSTAESASPAFIVPKSDPTVLPRMVIDYRQCNANTIKDRTPLPKVDDILELCGKAKYWGKIDMTNAFFQTRVHPDDVHLTAFTTPFGMYEWNVMPMGFCNSPSIHQRRMYKALRHLIGKICHIFMDDIIFWANSLKEHEENARQVLLALREADLYCSPRKTILFSVETEFLGHIISRNGIAADPKKIEKIVNWPTPQSVTDVRAFLGLTQYLRKFIKDLAKHTAILTPLTMKEQQKSPFIWNSTHQLAFVTIKGIVTTLPCLTVIDYDSDDNIYVTTDASKEGVGAYLSQGKTWETARPVAFESRQFSSAEKNYPVHEQELLAVVHALKKWRVYLLGVHFKVRTDHESLKYLMTQKDLSRRQARWQELLADYDFEIAYTPGKTNSVADSLSRYPFHQTPELQVPIQVSSLSSSTVHLDSNYVDHIKEGYLKDPFFINMRKNISSIPGAQVQNGLLLIGNRLCLPADKEMRREFIHNAHDALGHFGDAKVTEVLRKSYFWPHMAKDIEKYCKTCDACQRYKSSTQAPVGPLHSLPVPTN
ncbi:MAG: RNase H-like domain-containing protein, partial [Candidatus Saccharimonadales bacterium]